MDSQIYGCTPFTVTTALHRSRRGVLERAREAGLDVIAITGIEITTAEGLGMKSLSWQTISAALRIQDVAQ